MSDHDFLGMLSEEESRALQARAITRSFRRGAALLREGEDPTRVLVLTQGRAKAVRTLRELGWIETGRRTISVREREALRRFAR